MLDYDRLTKLLDNDDISHAEIITYHVKNGNFFIKKTYIDYYNDDYQWSTTTKPIKSKYEN